MPRLLQLPDVIPVNAGGFGDVEKAMRMFIRNGIVPLQVCLPSVSDRFDAEVFRVQAAGRRPHPGWWTNKSVLYNKYVAYDDFATGSQAGR